jgi:membrane protease YdiL (CAAX protease family)
VIPADPWQLLYLIGAVFLFVCPRLSWWSSDFLSELQQPLSRQHEFSSKFVLCIWPINFAGLAGYFVCFWPGKNSVRRMLGFVVGPAIIGLGLFFYWIPTFLAPYTSVLQPGMHLQRKLGDLAFIFWKYSPGFCFCAAGLLFILLFTFRLASGRSSLPLSLPAESYVHADESDDWQRIRLLIWVFVGFFYLLCSFGASILLILWMSYPQISILVSNPGFVVADYVIQAIISVGVAWVVVGKKGLRVVRQYLQLPEPRLVLLGLLLPLGIFLLLPTGVFLFDYTQWAAHDFGKLEHPFFSSYIQGLPEAKLLWMGLPALAEEIIFRGLLQSSLIRRYGLFPGIFLTNLTWGAYHFRVDVYSRPSVGFFLLELVSRILICLALGYVLSWLTLRSRSIWPATVTHTVFNIFVLASFGPEIEWGNELRILMWGVLALLLFRFWPVATAEDPAPDSPITSLEPAV